MNQVCTCSGKAKDFDDLFHGYGLGKAAPPPPPPPVGLTNKSTLGIADYPKAMMSAGIAVFLSFSPTEPGVLEADERA